jgi:hypothetical protein
VSTIANKEIRDAARDAGVRLWQIAERIGMNDGNFSRKLRRELPDQEKKDVLEIIKTLAAEKTEVS